MKAAEMLVMDVAEVEAVLVQEGWQRLGKSLRWRATHDNQRGRAAALQALERFQEHIPEEAGLLDASHAGVRAPAREGDYAAARARARPLARDGQFRGKYARAGARTSAKGEA